MDLNRLRAEHGELYEIRAGDVAVVCKRPHRHAFQRFLARAADPQRRYAAFEDLLRDCCVHPVGDELDALCERYPAAVVTIAGRLVEIAGAAEDAEVKAL